MRMNIILFFCFVIYFCNAYPVKSMLGAEGTGNVEAEEKPYDYEVEYITGTGSQYILLPCDVPALRSTAPSIEIKFHFPYRNLTHLFGCGTGSREYCAVYDRYQNINYLFGNSGYSRGTSHEDIHTIYMSPSDNFVIEDGTLYQVTFNQLNGPSDSICIFGYYNTSTKAVSQIARASIYYVKIYDAETDTIIYDLIPVRKNGEGCIYDKVSGELFHNMGSGYFGIGPDK